MWPRILPILILVAMLTLNGCVRLASERHVVWARLGTPAKIIHEKPVQILIPLTDEQGNVSWKLGEASLQGMIAIDEPTLEFYQQLNGNAQHLGNP